jgi:hypothetical protein
VLDELPETTAPPAVTAALLLLDRPAFDVYGTAAAAA